MAESFRNAYASIDFICASSGVCLTTKHLEAILNEQMVKLAKDMKREKEEEITALQKELYWKDTLEWVVEALKKGIKHMNEEGDLATKNKLRPIEEDLKIQQCKLDGFKQKEEMLAKHKKELEMMQQKELEHLDTIFGVYKTSKQQSEDQLKLRKNKLRQLEELDESFKRKLDPEKEMKEKEQELKKINVLQRELDQNQALKMEIETLKHDIKVMRHMNEERDIAAKSKLTSVEKELKDKQGELDYLEKINYQLIIQQLRDYVDLRKIRKALILSGSVIRVQQKDNETMTRLVEDLKREKEQSLDKINVLQRELDRKQALELEIETLKRDFEVMRQMNEEGDLATNKKLTSIKEELKDKQDELDYLENINNELIIKQRRDNDQVQEARKALINGLKDTRCNICVKRMGELDQKPFISAAMQKYSKEEAPDKALELCSLWEDHLRDPHWHPFKVIKNGEKYVGVIDEEDEKLVGLKNEYGDEVYVAVTIALKELNEYNSSGRTTMPSSLTLGWRRMDQHVIKAMSPQGLWELSHWSICLLRMMFSVGAVLREMLSGRRVINYNRPCGEHNLVEWAKPYLANNRKVSHVLDNRLEGQYTLEVSQKVVNLASHCLSNYPRFRPTMDDVVKELEQLKESKDMTTLDNKNNGSRHRRRSDSAVKEQEQLKEPDDMTTLNNTNNGSRNHRRSDDDAAIAYPRPSTSPVYAK